MEEKKTLTDKICDHIADPNPLELLLIAAIGGPVLAVWWMLKTAFWVIASMWPLFL